MKRLKDLISVRVTRQNILKFPCRSSGAIHQLAVNMLPLEYRNYQLVQAATARV